MSDQNLINLSDFIKQVKADLSAPKEADDKPMFYIDSIEIEAQVVVSREQSGQAGLKLAVFNFGAEVGVNTKNERIDTQKLTIKLSPLFDKQQLLDKLPTGREAELAEIAVDNIVRTVGDEGSGIQVSIATSRGPLSNDG